MSTRSPRGPLDGSIAVRLGPGGVGPRRIGPGGIGCRGVGPGGRCQSSPGAVEPALADGRQPLTALPQREGLVEGGAARLEPAYDLDQLVARRFVRHVVGGLGLARIDTVLLSHLVPRSP